MMPRPLAALLALYVLSPAGAGAQQVADWLVAQSGGPREVRQVARFTPDSPKILGADPLTYDPGYPFDFIAVPPGPAEVVALMEPVEGRVALAAMIFADGAPVCGDEAGADEQSVVQRDVQRWAGAKQPGEEIGGDQREQEAHPEHLGGMAAGVAFRIAP